MKEFVYARFLLPAVERSATATCVHDGDYHATFAEHGRRVLRLRSALERELGLSSRDRFAVLSLNSHEMLELYHAALLGAGVITPLNIRLSPAELAHVLRDAEPSVVLVDERLAPLYGAVVAAGEDSGSDHRWRLVRISIASSSASPADPSGRPRTEGPTHGDGWWHTAPGYEELISAADAVRPPEPDEDDPVALVYTGGTTGLPRGAQFTHRSLLLYMYHAGLAGGVGFEAGSVFLHSAPMFHSTTIAPVLSAPAFGVTSVISPRFDPADSLDTIERHRVTDTILVPTMIQMLLGHERFAPERISSLRRIGYGGMPMAPELLDRLRSLAPGAELVQGYGMTEAGALTVLAASDHRRTELLASVGRAVPGVVLEIQSPDGTPLGPRSVGEVCAKGGNVMAGYWRDPTGTAEAFRGGWYHSGDAGYLDQDGYLFLVDRLGDTIVTGGENVYSVRVEQVIASHPAVAQVAVVGLPDELWGERVHAIVVPRPGSSLSPDEVIAHARKSLAGYEVPKSVEIRTEPLPLSAAMKPLKRELRPKVRPAR